MPCAPLPTAVGSPGSLRQGGGSPQPPDHCDTRARICRHRGDAGVARPLANPIPMGLGDHGSRFPSLSWF